jgi:putative membrane protein
MTIETLFSDEDLRRIEEAVGCAEARTRGELVVAAVPASGDYPGTAWMGACLGALAALSAAVLYHWLGRSWGFGSPFLVLLVSAAGAVLGHLLAGRVAFLKRHLTPDDELDAQVDLAARAAFVEHEVFATRDRSGVLLFLSILEHRVVVLADSGVEAVVEPGEWQAIVDRVVIGIRAGRACDALVEAIERCGDILARTGLERRSDDADELDNRLRLPND